MKFIRSNWCPLCIGVAFFVVILSPLFTTPLLKSAETVKAPFDESALWVAPSFSDIPNDSTGDLIRYGKELITNTAFYLGPQGIVAHTSNGMNCQNCHLDAGTRNFSNPFSAVSSTYPKWRDRSGRNESIEFRVNDCMQRSLNGQPLDSNGYEMKAYVAYLKWIGKEVPREVKPKGGGVPQLVYLERPANLDKGKLIFNQQCSRCHGQYGEGVPLADRTGYTYPPLWGEKSFNTGAGLYRLSNLAGFIKSSMPFDKMEALPLLSDEEAWDVAAFIASQPRTEKRFSFDWPNIAKKPVDLPFGPYTDSFSETQHKYGPYKPIMEKKQAH